MNIATLLGGLSLQAPTLQVVVRGICRMAVCCGGANGRSALRSNGSARFDDDVEQLDEREERIVREQGPVECLNTAFKRLHKIEFSFFTFFNPLCCFFSYFCAGIIMLIFL